jgi:hypothetical protein
MSSSLELCFAQLLFIQNVTAGPSIACFFNSSTSNVTVCNQYDVPLASLCARIPMLLPSRVHSLTYFPQTV